MSRSKAVLGLVGALLVYTLFVGHSVWQHFHGHPVFWLQELWTPTAIVSILIVTFVERLVRPGAQAPQAALAPARKPRRPRKAPSRARKS